MELDTLWEHIFSEDERLVRLAWDELSDDERASVRTLLESITVDAERVEEQRVAARFALSVIQAPQIVTANASYHPVAGAAQPSNGDPATLEPGWESGRRTYCTDCHSNANPAEPKGPHPPKP